MSQQVTTKMQKVESIMRRAPFVRGFKDVRRGKPMDYDAYLHVTNDRWDYERGRSFALVYSGDLKNGARLTWQAKAAMQSALVNRLII